MSSNMLLYKVMKPVLGFLYKVYYNPKIIGKENIVEDGPIVVVGNHVHIMDQCNVIISTKRHLHYMAKKEYFDGKFAWFFKSVGCIPVNRSIHDSNAKSAALDVLNNKHALGIFPEGTRNAVKEAYAKTLHKKYFSELEFKEFYKKIKKNKTSYVEFMEKLLDEEKINIEEFKNNIKDVNSFLKMLVKKKRISEDEYFDNILLPFKFGAVSMAKKTNAYIVPYAITGEYKFRSKDLTIRIGKPFKVEDELDKVNKKLRDEVISLMKKSLKNK